MGTELYYYPSAEGDTKGDGRVRIEINETWNEDDNTSHIIAKFQVKGNVKGSWTSSGSVTLNGVSIYVNNSYKSAISTNWTTWFETDIGKIKHDDEGNLAIKLVVTKSTGSIQYFHVYSDYNSIGLTATNEDIVLHKNQLSKVHIKTENGYEAYSIHIYSGAQWNKYRGYIYTDGNWTKCV